MGVGVVTCPSCGAQNPAENRFCGQCAAPLALTCPQCGAIAQPGQRFCGQCATALGEATAVPVPAPRAASVAEMRPVSVLFLDLVGFTSLAEQRDPADVRDMLGRYFEIARTVVTRYGGTVEKFIGDAVMAVWGSPVAREDDAERAVRAGLELIDAVTAFGATVGLPDLRARGGIVTGQVASVANTDEALVVGDRVNTASRLQALAPPGAVYVDETTRLLTSASIAYSDAGEHTVKGKAEPIHAWQANRVVGVVGGSQRVDGLEADFVGRDSELRLLKELFHSCADRGAARLVSVTGAAGVGKSRLRWEFEKYVDGLADFVVWHSGHCLSYGDGVAYWALAEMVRQRLGTAEEDPSEVVATRLIETLDEWVPDESEREYLQPRLAALLGTADPGLGREELFAGWRLFFERLSDRNGEPVMLVFEDLQWADAGLLDFIEYLLEWSADRPIFVLTFARTEFSDRRSDWASGRRNTTALYLDPLPESAMRELLGHLVPNLPDGVQQRIIEQAEGIPLYAVETIRTLIDRDIVVPREGIYTLVGEVGDLDVPATLTSLLASRIDVLPPDERALVKDLSVLGGSFPRQAAQAIGGLSDQELDRLLANLLRKEVLTVRTDRLSPDRGQYAFAQTMLRTVAYEMLSRHERKARHIAVAEHLRNTFDNDGEDVVEVIAAHYHDAYRAAAEDADADAIRAEAVTSYERAGRRAVAVAALETAEQAYLRAAELSTDEEQATRFIEVAADAAMRASRNEVAIELCDRAEEAHRRAGRTRDAARIAVTKGNALSRTGRGDEAVHLLREALEVLDTGSAADPDVASVTERLAVNLAFRGDQAEALSYVERALPMAQALQLPMVFARALLTKGNILQAQDRPEEALIHYEAAVDVAERHELLGELSRAYITSCDCRMNSDLDAEELGNLALTLARRRGDRHSEVLNVGNLVYIWIFAGRWAEAEKTLSELLASSPDSSVAAYIYLRFVMLNVLRGQVAEGRAAMAGIQHWADSSDLTDRTQQIGLEAALLLADGDAQAALATISGPLREAIPAIGLRNEAIREAWPTAVDAALRLGSLDEASELLALVGDRPHGIVPPYLRAQLARLRARLHAARDPAADVSAEFAIAEEQLHTLGYLYWLAVVQMEHADWLVSHSRRAEAQPLIDEAAGVFERLGVAPMLDRLRALATPLVLTTQA